MSLITPDFGLIFWMTLIFAIVFFIVAKFGFPVITGMAGQRADKIAEGLRKAEEAEKQFAELSEKCELMLKETKEKQAAILKEASVQSEQIVAKAKLQAQDEAARLIENARVQIQAEREGVMRELRREVASISVSIAEKVVRRELSSDQAQADYLNTLVDEVRKTERQS